jgi:hypothetical protein
MHGMLNGEGSYTYSDGSKYVGTYKDDKREGWGTFTWAGGKHYEGEWHEGM